MPIFSEHIQLEDNYKDFKFNWICTCPGTIEESMCKSAFYKDKKYYNNCNEKKSDKINKKRQTIIKTQTIEMTLSDFSRNYNFLRVISGIPSLKYS